MSLLHCDGPRRFSRPTSARTFPETYYNERHAPLDYTRADPYAFPMGGPVRGLRAQSHMDREQFQVEQPGARRRIAVAVSQTIFLSRVSFVVHHTTIVLRPISHQLTTSVVCALSQEKDTLQWR